MLRYLYVYTAWRRVYFFSGLYGRVGLSYSFKTLTVVSSCGIAALQLGQ